MKLSSSRDLRRGFLFLTVICSLVLSFPFFLPAESEQASPSIEELSKTKAARFFYSKKYPEALAEFQELEKTYPKNTIVKRYIAVLLSATGKLEEAAAKLREITALDPNDLTARRKLGEVYLKQQKPEDAIRELSGVLEKRPGDPVALKKLTRAKQLITQPLKKMPADEFIQSAPARNFLKGHYPEALAGFEGLKEKYSDDVLIRRFMALTQLRLNRKKEAVTTLQEALRIEPENKALHYYLGQVWRENDKEDLARFEFRWVIDHDSGPYRRKAAQALFRKKEAKPRKKNWGLSLLTGYEFDTNATFKSRDRTFSSAGDKNSSRYPLTVSGYARFYKTSRWSFTSDAFYSQALYQDFNRLNTYTTGGGLSGLYSFHFLNRPSFFNLREGISHTFLESKYYTWTNALSASFIHDLTSHLRISTDYRFGLNQFESRGTDSGLTRRDGFDHFAGLDGTYYFTAKKDLSLTLGYGYEHDAARGKNFMKHAHEGSVEFNFPLVQKISGKTTFRFRDSDYPEYGFTAPPRRDKRFLFSVALSRPVFKNVTLIGKYAFEDSLGRNNLYEYNRHIFSVLLSCKY